jgi:hypothetical protein
LSSAPSLASRWNVHVAEGKSTVTTVSIDFKVAFYKTNATLT